MPYRRRIPTAVALALALGLTVAPARAAEIVETFDAGKAPAQILGGSVKPGRDGAWNAALADGTFTLSNDSDPQAIKYFKIDGFGGDNDGLADASVAVDVDVGNAGDMAGAGIVYRFDAANRSYLLFTLMGNDQYGAFARGPNGFKPIARGSVAGLRPGANRLEVRTEGERIVFLVNDTPAASLVVRGATGKSVGLAAIGKGTFTFDNFAIRDEG